MAIQHEIGERLKKTRIAHGNNQKDIGDIIGVTDRQIGRWENGTQEMGIFKLRTFCLKYGISADYILGITTD